MWLYWKDIELNLTATLLQCPFVVIIIMSANVSNISLKESNNNMPKLLIERMKLNVKKVYTLFWNIDLWMQWIFLVL